MKRLIVHIGPRKTGSTSIQRLLASRAAGLSGAGIHVPLAGRAHPGRGTHIALAREAARGITANWDRLAREIRASARDTLVISAEDFATPPYRAKAAQRLAELVAAERLDVRIVGYVRPQWQLLESEFSQQVRGGRVAAPFGAFTDRALRAGPETILDFNRVFAPYRARFGDRVRVFPLEPAALPGGLLAHFLGEIGAPAEVLDGAGATRANRRRGAKEIAVWRRLRERLDGPRRQRSWPALPRLRSVIGPDAPFAGFSEAGIRALNGRFADANARFARDYGVDAGGRLFRDAEPGGGAADRPNLASWQGLDRETRRRVTGYVRRETGVDLEDRSGRARRGRRTRVATTMTGPAPDRAGAGGDEGRR